MTRSLLAAILALSFLSVAAADTLVTTDGRVVEGCAIQRTAEGASVKFKKGTVSVPRSLIRIVVLDSDDEGHDEERQEAEEATLRRSWQNRRRLKTEHFVFEFTVPDALIRPVAERLETFATALYSEWGLKLSTTERQRVQAACSGTQAEQVFGISPGSSGRLGTGSSPEISVFLDHRDIAGGEKVLRHLTARTLLRALGPDLEFPLFPRLPLGDYYAADREGPAGDWLLGAKDGGHLERIRLAVKYGQEPSISSLLTTPLSRETRPFAWSLVRFLLHDQRYGPRFRAYITALAQSDDVERVKAPGESRRRIHPAENLRVFRDALSLSSDEQLQALTRDWHATLQEDIDETDLDQCLEAARAAVRSKDARSALGHYEQAIRLGCERSIVYLEIGRLMLSEGNLTGTMTAWQRARSLDPLDPTVTGALGRLLIRRRARSEGMRLLDLAVEMNRAVR